MIPLQKLIRLPRKQGLRKLVKVLTEIERSLPERYHDMEYIKGINSFLSADEVFDKGVAKELSKAITCISHTLDTGSMDICRPINQIRHILLSELGIMQADWDFIDHEGLLDDRSRRIFPGVKLFLEDIRSPYNVGSIFRTAESFGVEKLLLSPFCADPNHPRALRTAMGCTTILPWERLSLDSLHGPVFALETGGTLIQDFSFPTMDEGGTMLLGSEELGLSPEALAISDASLGRVSIPTFGAKGSLNVSVAFGIVMQLWAQRLAQAESG